MIQVKLNRKQQRQRVKGTSRNHFAGVPKQIIIMGNSHKFIRHKPKPCLGIYNPKIN